jgi:hypothetical protein
MPAGYQDLFIEQSSDFSANVTLQDGLGGFYNLNAFRVASQARKSAFSANATITFVTTVADANNGIINLAVKANTTANITPSTLVYDVLIQDIASNTITRVLEGRIFITPAITSIKLFPNV